MSTFQLMQRHEIMEGCFKKVQKMVALCAIEALNQSLPETWFTDLIADEQQKLNQKKFVPILHVRKNEKVELKIDTPEKIDFQAVIKIITKNKAQRDPLAKQFSLNTTALTDLGDKLIDLRNKIIAHEGAQEMLKDLHTRTPEEQQEIIYNYNLLMVGFIQFLSYFPTIQIGDDSPFYEQATQEWDNTKNRLKIVRYSVEQVIAEEHLPVSPREFSAICSRIHITAYSEKGQRYFFTDEYEKDIEAIRVIAELQQQATTPAPTPLFVQSKPQKKTPYALIAVLVGVILLLISLLMWVLWLLPQWSGSDDTTTTTTVAAGTPLPSGTTVGSPSSDTGSSATTTVAVPTGTHIRGEGSFGGLTLRIDQKAAGTLMFTYENDHRMAYSLGWVNQAEVVIETSVKTYYGSVISNNMTHKIGKNASGEYMVSLPEDVEGVISRVTVNNVCPLDESGLPSIMGSEGTSIRIPITYS